MVRWGYMLDMPRCPSRARQKSILQTLGVDMTSGGPWAIDKIETIKRHATAGQTQLVERQTLIDATAPGDEVVVADVMCLGVSAADAGWFLARMAQKSVTVIVNGDMAKIDPGGDAKPVLDEMSRRIAAWYVRQHRARERHMPEGVGTSYGLDHLVSMRERITDDFSEAKLGRWLGWAQCAVVFSGVATLDEMKHLNFSFSDSHTG